MSLIAATVTAVLMAVASPTSEPMVFAAFFTGAGPSLCETTAANLNAAATKPEDAKFYCE